MCKNGIEPWLMISRVNAFSKQLLGRAKLKTFQSCKAASAAQVRTNSVSLQLWSKHENKTNLEMMKMNKPLHIILEKFCSQFLMFSKISNHSNSKMSTEYMYWFIHFHQHGNSFSFDLTSEFVPHGICSTWCCDCGHVNT